MEASSGELLGLMSASHRYRLKDDEALEMVAYKVTIILDVFYAPEKHHCKKFEYHCDCHNEEKCHN